MSRLAKLTSRHGSYVPDVHENVDVFHVNNPHVLTQAAGYLKFIHGQANPVGIFYRGQSKLYKGSLVPSLYRNPNPNRSGSSFGIAAANSCAAELNKFVTACKRQGKVLAQVPEFAWEPLLQHYGLNTRWIDVVDNVWVALWFACHHAMSTGVRNQHLHFEQRYPSSSDKFAYIVLVQAPLTPDGTQRGVSSDAKTELIDLRIAAPSTFLRPHAQTGLLVRLKGLQSKLDLDYHALIAGVLRIDLTNALDWLGDGKLLSTHALFPPPTYDFGYADLLNYASPLLAGLPKSVGAIHHVGA